MYIALYLRENGSSIGTAKKGKEISDGEIEQRGEREKSRVHEGNNYGNGTFLSPHLDWASPEAMEPWKMQPVEKPR